MKTVLRVQGLDCAEEVALLRHAFAGQTGIHDLSFELIHGRMTIEHDEQVGIDRLQQLIRGTGLEAEPWTAAPATAPSLWQQHQPYVFAAGSGGLLLAGMFVSAVQSSLPWYLQLVHGSSEEPISKTAVAFFLGSVALGYSPFLRKAWASLRAIRPDMNLLLAVSLTGALVLGEWAEAATLSFLFALAGLIESWSLMLARRGLTTVLTEAPRTATVVHDHGEHVLPVDKVAVGERIRVRPGECIPCDGVIIAGDSEVNQSAITGEALSRWKKTGDMVYAGSINGDGFLELRTTSLAEDTKLARMLRLLDTSDRHRSPSEQVIGRFVRYYTPLVLFTAVASLLLSGGAPADGIYTAMTVLLVACPCALVLSTPVTTVSALASAARRGVIVKGASVLEMAAKVTAMTLDKTGVVTKGTPRVKTFALLNGQPAEQVLSCLHGLEQYSEHPVGRAIVDYAREQGVAACAASHFRACAGYGAEVEVHHSAFWAGSRRVTQVNGSFAPVVDATLIALEQQQQTAVVCGMGNEAWAAIGLEDPIRDSAPGAVARLHQLGIQRLALVTGDNHGAAQAAAAAVDIPEAFAEMMPDDKASVVKRLRPPQGVIAMVGDGINDAPAMDEADVAIAFGPRATGVAQELADVVILSENLDRLPFLVLHARRAQRVIWQNVGLALLRKGAFVGLAFSGHSSLWMAIAADTGATLLVTINGLRLLRIPSRHLPVSSS